MSYQSVALATPNLADLWMMTATAGALSEPDLGPNNLPLTYNTAKVDGVENISGAGPGMLSTTAPKYAFRTVTAGSPLNLMTGPYTIAAWVTPNTFPTAGVNVIAGRQNHFRSFMGTLGTFGHNGWNPTPYDSRTAFPWTAGVPAFVATTFSTVMARTYVNGEFVQETNISSPTLQTVTDQFTVGFTSANLDGTISGVGVWTRALNLAEIWALFVAGTKVTPVNNGWAEDNQYDAGSPVIAASAPTTACAGCHGARRGAEPMVTRTNGLQYHLACYAVNGVSKGVIVPTATTTHAAYSGNIMREIDFHIRTICTRITSSPRTIYFDGTRIQPTTVPNTSHYDVYMPFACTAALLLRYQNAPKEHPYVQLVTSQMERLWSLQAADGHITPDDGGTAGGIDFIASSVGEAVLCMKAYVTPTVWNRWKTNYLAMMDSMWTYPAGAPESGFYVNGNRESFELAGYWMAYMVGGESKWLTRYEQQYSFLTTLAAKNASADSTGNKTYGFVTVVAPTQADGSDGKGYLIERTSTRLSQLTGPDGQILDGYDPNYNAFGILALTRTWLYNRDPRLLKIMNMVYNMVIDLVNTTSPVGQGGFILNGVGGSRQNNTASFGNPLVPVLRFVANQTRIPASYVPSVFSEVQRVYHNDLQGSTTLSRDVSTTLGTWLLSLPDWPGLPGAFSAVPGQTSDTTPPSIPTATAATNISNSAFTANWTGSTDAVGVTGYSVYVNGVLYATTTNLTFVVTGRSAATTYSVQVLAQDAAGNASALSNTVSVTTAPAAPTNLAASSVTSTSFTLTWDAMPTATAYEVQSNGSVVGTPTATTISLSGLTASTGYSVRVRARNAAGNYSTLSSALTVNTTATSTTTTQSLFTTQTPSTPNQTDNQGLTAGLRFTSDIAGDVTGIRMYRATTAPTASVVGVLYTEAGVELARATFGPLSTGWNTATFTTPVTITADTNYRAVYWTDGPYVASSGLFPLTNNHLTGIGGCWVYGAAPAFPTNTSASAYFADVVFAVSSTAAATVPGTPVAPTVTAGNTLLNVSWAAPSSGGSPITGYDVQTLQGTTVVSTTSPVGTARTLQVTGLTNGTSYTVKVRAKNAVGAGSYSTASIAVAPAVASSSKPGASNTGVPTGTTLTAYTGPMTITADNTIIDSKDINGEITITAANVIIRKCKIHGDGNPDGIGVNNLGGGLLLEDCEIYNFGTGVVYENFTVTRCNLHGMTYDTFKISSNSTIQDSWIHDPQPDAGAHWDGAQVQNGVVNTNILRNNFDVAGVGAAGGTANSCCFLTPDLGPSTNGPLTVDGNWFDGGNFSLNVLDGNNGQYFIRDIYIRNNRFGPNHQYGYANINVPIVSSGNVVDATGAPLL